MVNNMGYFIDKELYHHGILGQKWGKRNGPPYPLGEEDHSAAEKKADYKKSIDGKKVAKVVGITAAALLVTYGGYKITTSPHAKAAMYRVLNGSKEKRISDISKFIDKMGPDIVKKSDLIGDIPKLDSVSSVKDLATDKIPKNVSEAFGNLENNPLKHSHPNDCTNVFLAFEGRSRGLDVKPGFQENGEGLPYHEVMACFKEKVDSMGNSCFKERKNVDSLEKATGLLSRYPDGSRGYMSGNFTIQGKTFNHAIAWSKEDGKISFGDGINGLKASKYFDSIDSSQPVKYFRSDNLEFEDANYLKHVTT